MISSVPTHHIVDTHYPTQMFLTMLHNIVDPNIEMRGHQQYDSTSYNRTMTFILHECGVQVVEQLQFTDEEFYRHMLGLPEMTMLGQVASFQDPVRRQQFFNAFREWAIVVRSVIQARIPMVPHRYEYVLSTATPRMICFDQYWTGQAEQIVYQDMLDATRLGGF